MWMVTFLQINILYSISYIVCVVLYMYCNCLTGIVTNCICMLCFVICYITVLCCYHCIKSVYSMVRYLCLWLYNVKCSVFFVLNLLCRFVHYVVVFLVLSSSCALVFLYRHDILRIGQLDCSHLYEFAFKLFEWYVYIAHRW